MDFVAHFGSLALGSRMRRLSDRLMREVAEIYAEHDVSFEPRWFPLTQWLIASETSTVARAAEALGVSHASVSQVARQMEKAGLLQRRQLPEDLRKTMMCLTADGHSVVAELKPLWADLARALEEWMGEEPLLQTLTSVEARFEQRGLRARMARPERPAVEIVGWHPRHAAVFGDLNRSWIERNFVLEPSDERILLHPEESIIEQGGDILFAMVGEQVVGTVALVPDGTGWVELAKMAVDGRFRGLGIGSALMAAALSTCDERQWTRVFLISNSALAPALALYRRSGFVEVPLGNEGRYGRTNVKMVLGSGG